MSPNGLNLPPHGGPSELVLLLASIPPSDRGKLLQSAASFRPDRTFDLSFFVGPLRASFSEFWEARFCGPVPVTELRQALTPPIPIGMVMEFRKLNLTRTEEEIDAVLGQLTSHLVRRIRERNRPIQRSGQFTATKLSHDSSDPEA